MKMGHFMHETVQIRGFGPFKGSNPGVQTLKWAHLGPHLEGFELP